MQIVTPKALSFCLQEQSLTRGVLLLAVLESWCDLNCSGRWRAKYENLFCKVELDQEDDLILFMLSREYTYMGKPSVMKSLTN